MSRKTVSRGAAAAVLATLLTLASAAPSFAAPRPTGERGLKPQAGAWSLVLEISQRLTVWVFGDSGRHGGKPPTGITEKQSYGSDPNGQSIAADPAPPIGILPVVGGG